MLKKQGHRNACGEEEPSALPHLSFSAIFLLCYSQDVSVVLVIMEERTIITAATSFSPKALNITISECDLKKVKGVV